MEYDNNLLNNGLDLNQDYVQQGIKFLVVGAAVYYLFVLGVRCIILTALYRMIAHQQNLEVVPRASEAFRRAGHKIHLAEL